MTRPAITPGTGQQREGSLDEVGAVLCAIVSLTASTGSLEEEDARAVYSLACIGLSEWRLLDAEADNIGGGK